MINLAKNKTLLIAVALVIAVIAIVLSTVDIRTAKQYEGMIRQLEEQTEELKNSPVTSAENENFQPIREILQEGTAEEIPETSETPESPAKIRR